MSYTPEVSNIMCGHCKYCGSACKCIDHSKVHFFRPYFSCDVMTQHHSICSAFEPNNAAPAIVYEWAVLGGFEAWHKLFIEQWHNGKAPKTVSLILAKTPEGREHSDNRYAVPYDDFINCRIMRDDGIHYQTYEHIEISRKSPTGYKWVKDGPGILTFEEVITHEDATLSEMRRSGDKR